MRADITSRRNFKEFVKQGNSWKKQWSKGGCPYLQMYLAHLYICRYRQHPCFTTLAISLFHYFFFFNLLSNLEFSIFHCTVFFTIIMLLLKEWCHTSESPAVLVAIMLMLHSVWHSLLRWFLDLIAVQL